MVRFLLFILSFLQQFALSRLKKTPLSSLHTPNSKNSKLNKTPAVYAAEFSALGTEDKIDIVLQFELFASPVCCVSLFMSPVILVDNSGFLFIICFEKVLFTEECTT